MSPDDISLELDSIRAPETSEEQESHSRFSGSHTRRSKALVRSLGDRFDLRKRTPAEYEKHQLLDERIYSSGDIANLRRLDPRRGSPTASHTFWRLMVEELQREKLVQEEPAPEDEIDLRPWMVIIQSLATMSGLQNDNAKLGTAMAKVNISEARLTRLLAAQGDRLFHLVRTLAHQLRSKGQPADWADIADLVLSDGKPWADPVRYRIASDFYRQQYRESQKRADSDR